MDAANSVFVIEHNLELIKTADWVMDLGLEGGAAGGRLIAQVQGSYTGQFLRDIL